MDEELKDINDKNATNYSREGQLGSWAGNKDYQIRKGKKLARYIKEGCLFLPEGKIIILSTSANGGIIEDQIQKDLGDSFQIIASDISPVIKDDLTLISKLNADAYVLPFASQSVNGILDTEGALWYALMRDIEKNAFSSETSYSLDLIKEYLRVLKKDGVLIFDQDTANLISKTPDVGKLIKITKGIGDDMFKYSVFQSVLVHPPSDTA